MLITHRVAAIKDADQIIVLDQGKVVARGTHAQLIAEDGVYADLYRTQLDTEFDVVADGASGSRRFGEAG